MARRPVFSGKDLTILALVGTVIYLLSRQTIVVQPIIDTSGVSSAATDIAALLGKRKT